LLSQIFTILTGLIVPSISPFETFSLSMVESWSMGIPTIATNAFGMKEIVNTFYQDQEDENH
jgi:glycosyltransferase involved in cell wall biosynthesis